jgi:hypothetical protein
LFAKILHNNSLNKELLSPRFPRKTQCLSWFKNCWTEGMFQANTLDICWKEVFTLNDRKRDVYCIFVKWRFVAKCNLNESKTFNLFLAWNPGCVTCVCAFLDALR